MYNIIPAAAVFSRHDDTYVYGATITLRCGRFENPGDPAPPFTFRWTAPEGNNSLTRTSSSFQNTSTSSTLTFIAFQEDTGQYTCEIVGSTYGPDMTTLTIGSFSSYSYLSFCYYILIFLFRPQSQTFSMDQWT